MHRIVLWLNFLLISLLLSSCAVSQLNFQEGIKCFHSQNYRQAFIRLKPEADKGQPDAQYAIGYMYYYGKGVVENKKQAWIWINRAAAAGQVDAIEAVRILQSRPKRKNRDPFEPLIYGEGASESLS
ncbi:MAG: sel1 repeat family protein [Proteobacteria bacterium]|nr:sel1 repeat family protein [Pseudomonadota bacterium]